MLELRLVRVSEFLGATHGILCYDDAPALCTLEEPWLSNKQRVSCIPTGAYHMVRVKSPKFGDTFEVTDVPGRSGILFHVGNTLDDTEGCILLGTRYGMLNGKAAVMNSTKAFLLFMGKMAQRQEAILRIVSAVDNSFGEIQ
jgi:hypothetical protein